MSRRSWSVGPMRPSSEALTYLRLLGSCDACVGKRLALFGAPTCDDCLMILAEAAKAVLDDEEGDE